MSLCEKMYTAYWSVYGVELLYVCRCRDWRFAIDAGNVCTSVDCDVSRAGLQTDVEEQMRTKAEEAASCYDLLSTGLYKSSIGEDAAKIALFCQRQRLKKKEK